MAGPEAEPTLSSEQLEAAPQIQRVLDIAQTHIADKFPNVTAITLQDPSDARFWKIALHNRNAGKELTYIRMTSLIVNGIELFQLGNILTGEGPNPVPTAEHFYGTVDSKEASQLEAAKQAEARLISLLGLPPGESAKAVTQQIPA